MINIKKYMHKASVVMNNELSLWEKKSLIKYPRMFEWAYDICNMRIKRDYFEMESKLKKTFDNTHIPSSLITELVECSRIYDENRINELIERYDNIRNQLLYMDYECESYDKWKWLSAVYSGCGFLNAGNAMRRASEELLLSRKVSWNNERDKYAVYMKRGQFDEAEKALQQLMSKSGKVDSIYSYYLDLCKNKYDVRKYKCISKEEEEYQRVLKGKRIAFCGPATILSDDIDEIKEMDIVVRMNYFGMNSVPERQTELHVFSSYYSSYGVNRLLDQNNRQVSDEVDEQLEFKILRTPYANFDCIVNKADDFPKSRTIWMDTKYSNVLYESKMVSGVIAILHLALLTENPIYVYGNTLSAGKENHNKKYTSFLKDMYTDMNFLKGCAKHEMVSNRSVLLNLYKSGVIIPDMGLLEVLKMTDNEYVSNLERNRAHIEE